MADTYEAVHELDGSAHRSLTVGWQREYLDGWFAQALLPVATTAVSDYWFARAGYTPPAPPGASHPEDGRGWPR